MFVATPAPRRRRSLRFRGSALVWAVVFLLSGVRGAFAQADCPHHRTAAHEAAGAEAVNVHAAHGHAEHDAHPAREDTGSPAPGTHHDFCTCIGLCHGATAAPMPVPATATLPPVGTGTEPAPAGHRAEILPGRPPYELPYATAPPRSR